MPLLVTPRQLRQQSEFYHQIGSLLSAGVGLISALEMLGRNPPTRAFRRPADRLRGDLTRGFSFVEALQRLRHWVPAFDLALIGAGEQSGRLDAICRLLAEYYRERARLASAVIADLAYPLAVLHLAVLVFPTSGIYQLIWLGHWGGYLLGKVAILGPLYAGVLLVAYACQGRRGQRWRSLFETALHAVPVLGAARRQLALARLAAALESLITAGVPIIPAWDLAASASGSPAIGRAVAAWKPRVLAGETPAEAVRKSSVFPETFASLYQTGEISGRLDDSLKRLHTYFQEEGIHRLHLAAVWAPRLVYFGVALLVAYEVVHFWLGYFNQLNQFM